ncbi:MAG TPA: FtsX-like permease family protein [Epulopiscium sp.]|nr:FtsX-like permease family protein [Candidatus Epulonipiscium sp.]
MLKVNSKKTIQLLSKSSFAENKLRNLFAVIAIVLTAVLFTGLFTVAGSLITSMEESTMRQIGGNFHGGFKYLSSQQYDTLKTHPSIKEISYSVVLGIAENKELAKRPTEIRYANDEVNAKGMFSMPTTGRLPQKDDELATDTLVLERLGVPAEIGQRVTLTYSVGDQQQTDSFILVGLWQGDKLMSASQVWLNRTYVEKQLEGYHSSYDGDYIGTINANVNFSNTFNIENKLITVILDSGYTLDEINYGVNWAYAGNSGSLDAGTVVAAVGAVLIIVLCGYLMISNVFTISIAKDVRYYGLIKTIGTTPKQIRKIIRRQAFWMCILGVPVGLLAGYIVGMMLVPVVLSITTTDVIKISVHPLIFIFSGLFSILTVIISISKPSNIASKISPIEALRVTDNAGNMKRKSKKTVKVNLLSMAFSNIMRNKKKALLVTLSLSLGLIILNATYSAANSFDMDEYLSLMIGSDFAVGDVSNFNVNINYLNQETLSQDFFKQLSLQEGIEEISNIYFTEPLVPTDPNFIYIPPQVAVEYGLQGSRLSTMEEAARSPQQLLHIYGLDEGALERLTLLHGNIDRDKLNSGKYAIGTPYDEAGKILYYEIGDIVEIPDADCKIQQYEVLAIASIPYNISVQHSHPLTPNLYLPSEVFLKQIESKTPMLTTINVADNDVDSIEKFLNDYCNTIDPNMDFNSKASLAAEYNSTQRTFKTVGITLSALVALVGIMNFVNTVITSIISRRREIAMLQSMGMTGRQVMWMLVIESMIYILMIIAVTLTIGSAICYFGLGAFVSEASFMKLYFTVVPSLLCLPVLMIIAIAVPVISQKSVYKSSIVERLRGAE